MCSTPLSEHVRRPWTADAEARAIRLSGFRRDVVAEPNDQQAA